MSSRRPRIVLRSASLLSLSAVAITAGLVVACSSATEDGASSGSDLASDSTSAASEATVITPFGRLKAACGHSVDADGKVNAELAVSGCSASTSDARKKDAGAADAGKADAGKSDAGTKTDAGTSSDAGGPSTEAGTPTGTDDEPPSWAAWLEDDTTTGVSFLEADMVVPPLPTDASDQVVYMFPSLTPTENPPIIQPVLNYGAEGSGSSTVGGNYWTIADWYLDETGNYYISKVLKVAPGDKLHGTMQGTGTCANGVCSSWTITLADLTQPSLTTTLTTAAGSYKYVQLQGAVVETYNIESCSMMPAGPLQFTNIAAQANDGSTFTPSWTYLDLPGNITPCAISASYPAADAVDFTFTASSKK